MLVLDYLSSWRNVNGNKELLTRNIIARHGQVNFEFCCFLFPVVDFSIQVLSSGSWPFQQSCAFSLPIELERSFQRFTTFYSSQHSGRKLNWLYHMSKGEIVTNCFKNRYTLQVSVGRI